MTHASQIHASGSRKVGNVSYIEDSVQLPE